MTDTFEFEDKDYRTNYHPNFCKEVVEKFKNGQTIVEVCQDLGISKQTYYNWKKKHPEFKEAAKFGEEAAEAFHAKIGRMAMLGFPNPKDKEKFKDFNTTIYCFTMKTRFKWRETEDVEGDPEEKDSVQPVNVNFTVSQPAKEIEITNSKELQEQDDENE